MDKNRPALTWSPFLPGQTYVVSLADNCQKIIGEHSFFRTHETIYSRMDQVKFVEDSFWKFDMIWSVLTDHITSNFLNGVFHKFYLVHSWIPCLTCEWLLLVFKNFSYQLEEKTEEEVASIVESARAKAFEESINRVAILKVDPWRLWVWKQWIWNSLSIIHIFTRKTFVLTYVVYCICANTTLHDKTYTLNYISLYHVATFEGNFFVL